MHAPQADHGDDGQDARWHLGHDGSEDLGRGVCEGELQRETDGRTKLHRLASRLMILTLALPGHIFGHEEAGGGLLKLGREGGLVDPGGGLSGRDEGRRDGHDGGDEDEAELGHFEIIVYFLC